MHVLKYAYVKYMYWCIMYRTSTSTALYVYTYDTHTYGTVQVLGTRKVLVHVDTCAALEWIRIAYRDASIMRCMMRCIYMIDNHTCIGARARMIGPVKSASIECCICRVLYTSKT